MKTVCTNNCINVRFQYLSGWLYNNKGDYHDFLKIMLKKLAYSLRKIAFIILNRLIKKFANANQNHVLKSEDHKINRQIQEKRDRENVKNLLTCVTFDMCLTVSCGTYLVKLFLCWETDLKNQKWNR